MEYRIAFGWRLFIYITAPLIGTLGILLLFQFTGPLTEEIFWTNVFLLFLSLTLILGSIYSVLRLYKEKIELKEGKFTQHLVFSIKEINLDQIKGFRIDENYIHFLPIDDTKNSIKVSSYIERKNDLLSFLYKKFDNLDEKNKTKDLAEILANDKFGRDKQEREERYEFAKKTAKALKGATLVLMIWLIAFPYPYDLIVFLNVIMPIIALIVFYRFNGLIKLDSPKESVIPNLAIVIITPGMGLGLRCIFDFEILSFTNFWTPTIILSLVFFGLLFVRSDDLKGKDKFSIMNSFFLFIFIALYSSTSILMLNKIFDLKTPSIHQALVIDKIEPTDDNNFRLVLDEGWEPRINSIEEANVPEEFFYQTKIGDSVFVTVHEGAFKIPWYKVDDSRFNKSTIEDLNLQYDPDSTLFKLDKL